MWSKLVPTLLKPPVQRLDVARDICAYERYAKGAQTNVEELVV